MHIACIRVLALHAGVLVDRRFTFGLINTGMPSSIAVFDCSR